MGLYDRDYGRHDEMSPWERHQRSQQPKSMTIILVVVTVAIFLVDTIAAKQIAPGVSESRLMPWFGCYKQTLVQPWFWFQFVTYGFLHSLENVFHVGFNMFGLFVFGRTVEERLGRWEFLRFYLVSMLFGGIVGCLTYWLMGAPANAVVIGASGSVLAVTLLFACYNPQANILLMMVFPVKAWIVAVMFVAVNLLGSISMISGADGGRGGTAFTVHLAGIAFALAYFFYGWNLNWLNPAHYRQNLGRSVRRTRLKLHDPDAKLRKEKDEVDQILAKIHATGEESLTRAERRTLERHSRRQRELRNRE